MNTLQISLGLVSIIFNVCDMKILAVSLWPEKQNFFWSVQTKIHLMAEVYGSLYLWGSSEFSVIQCVYVVFGV